jgi:hypothetical protein
VGYEQLDGEVTVVGDRCVRCGRKHVISIRPRLTGSPL